MFARHQSVVVTLSRAVAMVISISIATRVELIVSLPPLSVSSVCQF